MCRYWIIIGLMLRLMLTNISFYDAKIHCLYCVQNLFVTLNNTSKGIFLYMYCNDII